MSGDTAQRRGFTKRPLSAAKDLLAGRVPELVIGYPLVMLIVFFAIPSTYLIAVTFFPQPQGEFYVFGFTLEHYAQLFESPIYLGYLIQTVEFAGLTTIVSVVVGYPIAYWLARVDSRMKREFYLLTIIASMWLTVIIRAYAIKVIFAGSGLFNSALISLGVVNSPVTGGNGYLTVLMGLCYGFLPFAILTMYTSVRNIDPALEEASRNLGATKLQTIRKVTLPLSRNGIAAAGALVFILAIGSYTVPVLLGNPSDWTLPVVITDAVRNRLNVPFASVLALLLTLLVVVLFWISVRFLGVGSEQLVGDEHEEGADG